MTRNLSQIVTELLAGPTERKDLSAQIQRLGLEIRLAVQDEDTVFGKLRGLIESFRDILPDEKQRYQAALKALSATSKMGRQQVIRALSGQLEELKVLERSIMPSLPAWRDELRTMEARSQALKNEMAGLRQRIAQLDAEELASRDTITRRKKDLDVAEKSIKDLFAGIGAEIGSISRNLEVVRSDTPYTQPAPGIRPSPPTQQPTPAPEKHAAKKELRKGAAAAGKKEPQRDEQKKEIEGAAPKQDTKYQRTCPMCGGPFNLLELEQKWQCFTCAHEESAADAVPESAKAEDGPVEMTPPRAEDLWPDDESPVKLQAAKDAEPAAPKKVAARSGGQHAAKKKSCPVCYKKMVWSPSEKVWSCPAGPHGRKR